MPNFLEFLRQKNLFNPASMGVNLPTSMQGPASLDMSGAYGGGPPQDINFGSTSPVGIPSSMGETSDNYDVTNRMRQLYNPTNDASQKFEQLISQYPQREKPGILRSLGAMIVDYTKGPEAGQAMVDQPFNEKLFDWKNKIPPVQANANLERQENVNSRTLAYQQISAELRDRAQQAKERNDDAKMKVSQHRADIYDFKARNPNMKFDFTGPKVKVLDPATGKITVTEWDTGNITKTDQINMNQENALERIDRTGEQARKTEETRQTGRESIVETRGWGQPVNVDDPDNPGKQIAVSINQITGAVKKIQVGEKNIGPIAKPSSTGGKPESESNKKMGEYRRARQLANTRPDLAPFIELDTVSPGSLKVIPSSENFFGNKSGPNLQQTKEINDAIYGTAPMASHSSSSMTKTQTNIKTGAKRTLVSTDGGKTWQVQ
jgi:hypothetical protein